MKDRRFNFGFLAALFALAGCLAGRAAEVTNVVQLAELPENVQAAVRTQTGKAKLDEIRRITDHGELTYEVDTGRGVKERSFTLDEDGQLLDRELFLAETPAEIQAAIKKFIGTGTLESITWQMEDGGVYYEVDMSRGALKRTFTLDDQGKMTEVQFYIAETPAPVRAAILEALGSGQLGDITKIIDDDKITYEVEFNPDTNSRTVTFDEKGALVSVEEDVELTDTPEAVQKTAKEQAADGRLGKVEKETEPGHVTYDVDLRRGGKWLTITIDTDGRIVP